MSYEANLETYNDYLESLIPNDEKKYTEHVVLVRRRGFSVDDKNRDSKCTTYILIKEIPPIPLRFLRSGDCFVSLPLTSINPPIQVCLGSSRNPETILFRKCIGDHNTKFSITSKVLHNTELKLSTPINFDDNEFNVISE